MEIEKNKYKIYRSNAKRGKLVKLFKNIDGWLLAKVEGHNVDGWSIPKYEKI